MLHMEGFCMARFLKYDQWETPLAKVVGQTLFVKHTCFDPILGFHQ